MIHQSVAEAIRIETNPESGEVWLVFKVTDEDFKKEILKNFSKDIELYIKKKSYLHE